MLTQNFTISETTLAHELSFLYIPGKTTKQLRIAELNLIMRDKAVLPSPDVMLADKHMDPASKMQWLQSSLRYQLADGLILVHFSDGIVTEGLSEDVIS